jgi:hypothetical protein
MRQPEHFLNDPRGLMRSTRLRIWKLTGNEWFDGTAQDERHSGQTTEADDDVEEDEEEDDDVEVDDDEEEETAPRTVDGDGDAPSRELARMRERTHASQNV